jgi:hypothetical protein
MMTSLLSWFAGQPQNRRAYPRRREGYRLWFAASGKWMPAAGIDISASGLGVLSPSELRVEEIDFRAMLQDKAIVVRAKKIWSQPGLYQGKPAWRYGLRITGIAADDWDAIVRYCNGGQVTEANVAQKQLELVRMQPDDVARLIPEKLQRRLLQMLVERRRLAPIGEKPPLVHYSYGGVIKRGDTLLHRLSIYSRVENAGSGEMESYDTVFLFDDNGQQALIEGE